MNTNMMAYKLNTAERIIKSKLSLNKTHPFFAYILMNMRIENSKSSEDCPTMGVNQYGRLYWNKDFVKKLDNDELNFVLAHEVSHIATLTFQRQGSRDMPLWNIATDLVINFCLLLENFKAPEGVLIPNHQGIWSMKTENNKDVTIDLNNKGAEEVYEELLHNSKKVKQGLKVTSDGGYEGSIDKHIEGDKDDKGKSTGEGKTDAQGKENEQNWKQKAIEGATQAKMRGKLSASMERMLQELLEPKIDWRSKLFHYITNDLPVDFSMRMPSRRFLSTGVYTPMVVKESLELIVGVDISGSISDEEYKDFMGEVIGIANSYRQVKMRVIAWASHVDERDDIEVTTQTQDRLMSNKFYGGGGTTLGCLADYIEQKNYKSRVFVILTDGYIERNPKLPNGNCLFVLSKGGSDEIVKDCGDVTSLNSERKK